MRRSKTKTCAECLFYDPADDVCGVCKVSDNIVESEQGECIDYKDRTIGGFVNDNFKA